MRTDNFTLPGADELWQILAKESPRKAVHLDYVATHPEIFMNLRELGMQSSVDMQWTEQYEQLGLEELVLQINESIQKLTTYVLSGKPSTGFLRAVYDDLAPQATPEHADTIFVFGSPHDARIIKAIELYVKGLAPRIMISGHGPHYRNSEITEADRMATVARAAGVPEQALTLESAAITIPDNVKRSLDLWEVGGEAPTNIIIIASGFVLRRACMDWYKFTPWNIRLMPVAATNINPRYTRDFWHTDKQAIAVVLNEYAKIVLETKIDYIRAERDTR